MNGSKMRKLHQQRDLSTKDQISNNLAEIEAKKQKKALKIALSLRVHPCFRPFFWGVRYVVVWGVGFEGVLPGSGPAVFRPVVRLCVVPHCVGGRPQSWWCRPVLRLLPRFRRLFGLSVLLFRPQRGHANSQPRTWTFRPSPSSLPWPRKTRRLLEMWIANSSTPTK